MPKPKRFIAISTETLSDKLVLINTSCGRALFNENGIGFDAAIEFLFNLIYERRSDSTTVFVCYAFSRDNEFIFSTMPSYLKDKLFRSQAVQKKVDEIELENECLDDVIFSKEAFDGEHDKAEFEKFVNHFALRDLLEVKHKSYDIKLVNGKSLIISRYGKTITFYDIFGFFKPLTLRKSIKLWFNKDLAGLDTKFWNDYKFFDRDKAVLRSTLECSAVATLAGTLDAELQKLGENLSRYYGASALASKWLGRFKAKGEMYNYRNRRQHAPELWKAVRQACYGGRSEQFKRGTIKDVFVYDINSAYAFACSYLPRMLRKPYFVKEWNDAPFSVWFCEYDFTNNANHYFGLFPNRDLDGATRYKLKGKGYFWQPEIQFALKHYPQCIKIGGGFVLDYERAEFAQSIESIYQVRLELQRQGNPLEKVFKLALASLYGKFCQKQGKGHYYNLFYAGFITSLTRMQLLEATKNNEQNTICFQTDAIHSTTDSLPVHNDSSLGNFKTVKFDVVTYLDNGVYRAYKQGEVVKEKTRGFRSFEFEKAMQEIKEHQTYSALCEFFIGHNLFTQNMFRGVDYLSNYKQEKTSSLSNDDRSVMRLFDRLDIDMTKEFSDSKPLLNWSGLESSVYQSNNFKQDFVLDRK